MLISDNDEDIESVDLIFDEKEQLIRLKHWAYYVHIINIEDSKVEEIIQVNTENLFKVLGKL